MSFRLPARDLDGQQLELYSQQHYAIDNGRRTRQWTQGNVYGMVDADTRSISWTRTKLMMEKLGSEGMELRRSQLPALCSMQRGSERKMRKGDGLLTCCGFSAGVLEVNINWRGAATSRRGL